MAVEHVDGPLVGRVVHLHEEECEACPSILPTVALAAGGGALVAWLLGRTLYKGDLIREVVRAQTNGAPVVRLPDAVW